MSNPNDTNTMRSLIEAANLITNPTTLVRDTWLTEEEVELYESDVPLDKKFMMKGSSFQVRKAIDGKGYTLYAVGRGGSGLRVVGKVASLDKNEVLKAAEEANKKAASDLLSSLGVPSIRKEEVEEAIAEATKRVGNGNQPMTGVPAGASKEDHEKARKANPFRVGLSKGVPAGAGAKTWSGKTTKLNKFGNYAVVAADENGSALSWANRTQAQNFSDRHNLNGVVEPSAMGRSFYVSVSDISEATRAGVAATKLNANLTEAKEYILWAVPKGETDQLHAQPIYTQGRSPQDVERVKALAAKEGWHSFRMQVLDLSQPFDAQKAFAKAVRPGSSRR